MSTMIARLGASKNWWNLAGRFGLDQESRRVLAGFRASRIGSHAEYQSHRAESRDLPGERQRSFRAGQEVAGLIQTDGFCFPCRAWRTFTTPAGSAHAGRPSVPNWREGLRCPDCGLNSRMRASVHLLADCLKAKRGSRLYVTENVTPLYRWLKARYPRTVGSEFLRDGTGPGNTNPAGIRHEDMTCLSFANGSLDHIVCLEVLEHVPDFRRALWECARALSPNGSLLLTAPFHRGERHLVRARLRDDGTIEHIEPPEYHGDPIDPEGCLCFYHFGWDLLDDFRAAGFREAASAVFWSGICVTRMAAASRSSFWHGSDVIERKTRSCLEFIAMGWPFAWRSAISGPA